MTNENSILSDLLTVVIPVYNEERNLPLCLECIKSLKNKVVVDSGSKDKTLEIAKAAGCDTLQFEWDGKFPKKRNWTLRNYPFKTPWIMFLDADERVTPAFLKELEHTLPKTSHDVFVVKFTNWFMGRMLRYGDRMRKTAIVRYGKGEYEHIEEHSWSTFPIELHEHIVTHGTIGEINACNEHHDRRTLASYYSKHCEYADWESNRYFAIKDWSILSKRERLKYRLITWKLFPLAYWFVSYIMKLGFLDGAPGFYFALNKMSYFYQIQAKIAEKRLNEREGAK